MASTSGTASHPLLLRHLSSVIVRNLSTHPSHSSSRRLLPSATSNGSLPPLNGAWDHDAPSAKDDMDLYLRQKRRRAASIVSTKASSSVASSSTADGSTGMQRSRSQTLRRSLSSGGSGTREEGVVASSSKDSLDELAGEDKGDWTFPLSRSTGMSRTRSGSRVSTVGGDEGGRVLQRVQESDSSSPSLKGKEKERVMKGKGKENGQTSYTSEAQQAREKKRRKELLCTLLVDSRITLSSLPAVDSTRMNGSRKGSLDSLASRQPASSCPFYLSRVESSTMHPSFPIDSVPPPQCSDTRQDGVSVGIWVRPHPSHSLEPDAGDWTLLLTYIVEFSALIPLCTSTTEFPPFHRPNTLIFLLHDTYYTSSFFLSSSEDSDEEEEEQDVEDHFSDPGVGTMVRRIPRERGKMRFERERVSSMGGVGGKGREVKGAGVGDIVKLLEIQRELERTLAEIGEMKERMDGVFGEEEGEIYLKRHVAEVQDRIDDVVACSADLRLDLQDAQASLDSDRRALKERRDKLKAALELNRQFNKTQRANEIILEHETLLQSSIHLAAETRRTSLINTLSTLFPIAPSPTASPTSLLFTILSLPLPNSSYPDSYSDDTLSSALSYAAQLTIYLAQYLAVPLSYEIKWMGSRTVIIDGISVMRGSRAFPLYGRGVDKYRFDYAVFLLNKNIEQLMYSKGLMVLDLRNTLPNLQTLLLSLSTISDTPSNPTTTTTTRTVPVPHPSPSVSISSISEALSTPFPSLPSPPSSPEGEDDEEFFTGRSPSTLRARSERSVSSVSTIRSYRTAHAVVVNGEEGDGEGEEKVKVVGRGRRGSLKVGINEEGEGGAGTV